MIEQQLVTKAVEKHSALQIYCLGVFRVIRPGEREAIGTISKHKMWLLFKYLIVHRGTAIRTEKLMDLLWPGNNDPTDTATLRTTISRLKLLLEPKRTVYGRSSYILYCKNTCTFNLNVPFWLDTDEFEDRCKMAHHLGETNRKTAIEIYQKALDLYQGDFLSEDLDLEWTVIPREHYQRLFIESIIEVATWLLELHDYSMVNTLLKRAIKIDPYQEQLQILQMKTLLAMGNLKAAAEHYSYCSSFLYKELGVKPSEEWKQLYKKIREAEGDTPNKLIMEGNLEPTINDNGPFVCDSDFFWNFLLFERRRLARNGGESSLVILELINDDSRKNVGSPRNEILEYLEAAVCQKLRKCDIVCRLDDHHLALLLPFTGNRGSRIAVDQINESFNECCQNPRSTLQVHIKRVIPL